MTSRPTPQLTTNNGQNYRSFWSCSQQRCTVDILDNRFFTGVRLHWAPPVRPEQGARAGAPLLGQWWLVLHQGECWVSRSSVTQTNWHNRGEKETPNKIVKFRLSSQLSIVEVTIFTFNVTGSIWRMESPGFYVGQRCWYAALQTNYWLYSEPDSLLI